VEVTNLTLFAIKMEFARHHFQVVREVTIVVTEFVTGLLVTVEDQADAMNLKDYVHLGKQDVDVFIRKHYSLQRAVLSALFYYAI